VCVCVHAYMGVCMYVPTDVRMNIILSRSVCLVHQLNIIVRMCLHSCRMYDDKGTHASKVYICQGTSG